jgi:hypothetical protein
MLIFRIGIAAFALVALLILQIVKRVVIKRSAPEKDVS